ncbi:ferrous iron transport protein B [Butyrivibrio hungatei DSM 14810]|uniref:Ferrous iron transport protein B n=1 Tax=Butyrivibrio hungatei DSM 14810 TaxID=1121132 RepID=A0A1M7S656_9FIRM|nr:ferrous iron transport protein B [Butyrivibrio hungatei]SHN54107.1 ferrous iron transport protein B [Butyrivibrio hungatei DSM 14810]
MEIKIALAGNPNSGKTTLFNDLTGSRQYVGNWPGVTVEKKEGKLKGAEYKDVVIQDLPGIYSLSPYTLEEVVSRTYLVTEKPDAIINIVDGTNIERNLYLTTQLLELNIPMIVALNMMDLVRKNGDKIDVKALSDALGCEVVELSALKSEGTDALVKKAVDLAKNKKKAEAKEVITGEAKAAVEKIEELLKGSVDDNFLRWNAIKAFERDEKAMEKLELSATRKSEIEEIIKACEKSLDDDSESIITNERYTYITGVTSKVVKKGRAKGELSVSDKIDKIVTNRILGLPIFALVMFLIYAIAMGGWSVSIGTRATDFTNDVIFGEWVPGFFDTILSALHVEEGTVLYGLIQDGIVAGVGAVIGFVPQMLVLFLLLSILEDIGYMARVAFVMDRIFRQFGLSGKSFIPCLVATGCGVPGVMASRTIENERDRKMTLMTTTFMPCGAKLPIIGLIAGAVFGGSPLIAASAYFIGIGSIILSGIILKKFKAFAGMPAPFVMELPAYHVPSFVGVLRATWERGWSFIKRAGSVIVISSIIIWFLSAFGTVNGHFGLVDNLFEDETVITDEYVSELAAKMDIPEEDVNAMDASLLASVGNAVSFVFKPLGFGNWKPTVATVTGLVAKEEVVGTFGVLYAYDDTEEELGEEGEQIWARVAADYTPIAAFSFMIFNLLCAPCFAAIGAIKREMNNAKWTWAAIGYMTVWAYVLALIVYNLGGLILGEVAFGFGTIVAVILLGTLIYLLFRKGYVASENEGREMAVKANA